MHPIVHVADSILEYQRQLAHIEHANDLGTTKSSMFEDMNNLVAQLSPMAKDIEKNYR